MGKTFPSINHIKQLTMIVFEEVKEMLDYYTIGSGSESRNHTIESVARRIIPLINSNQCNQAYTVICKEFPADSIDRLTILNTLLGFSDRVATLRI